LRDLVVSEPNIECKSDNEIRACCLFDEQKVVLSQRIVSKYNLLAVPVIDQEYHLQGMVVIDDVIEDLIRKSRTNKR
jgi:magnesium transporter